MKTLRQYLGILIAATLLFFLIKPFVQTHSELKDVTFQIQWKWLLSSFGLILFYWSIYVLPFAKLLGGIAQRNVSFHNAFRLFHLANITRYLPGRIWGFVRLLTLSERFGFCKTAVGVSLTLHVGIETALGGLIAMSLIFSKALQGTVQVLIDKISGHAVLLALACIGILAGLVFLVPSVSKHAQQFRKALRETGIPFFQKSFRKQWIYIFIGQILLWFCQVFAFFLFVKSLVSVQWKDVGIFSACYAFTWLVGFLSVLTPGGLGVREGLLGLLLANYMSTSQATLIALLCRVWMLSAEIVLAGAAFFHQLHSDKIK